MKRGVVGLPLLALLGIAACGGAEPVRPRVESRRPMSGTTVAALVGLWDDGLEGENTKLDLRGDGSAHVVSMAVVPATWTLDGDAHRVTITSRRQADGSTVTQHFAYKPGDDVLTGRLSAPGGPERVFRRASRDAVEWWSRVRPHVEAEATRRGGR
ncbi:MAG: hypothetical protein U1E39_14535 [Planctomycetota bacterium]